jgi:hypothetical protein
MKIIELKSEYVIVYDGQILLVEMRIKINIIGG